MKICQYLCLHMKIICWRFHVKIPFTFWVTRMWDMWNVCLQTFRDNKICWKLVYFLRNLQTLRANNSRILRIKNAKFSGYCFYTYTNIYRDFQICIIAPLKRWEDVSWVGVYAYCGSKKGNFSITLLLNGPIVK